MMLERDSRRRLTSSVDETIVRSRVGLARVKRVQADLGLAETARVAAGGNRTAAWRLPRLFSERVSLMIGLAVCAVALKNWW